MKNLAILLFCFFTLSGVAQYNIVAAEYFIGNDPGIGNATSLEVAQDEILNESFQIPVSGLNDGFHFLHIRVLNSNGAWSHFAKKMFAVSTPIEQSQLADAEYFIGEDPGFGNANPIDVQTGDTILSTFEIPLADLSENEFHFLHIRARDSNGKWSHYSKKMFTVIAPTEQFQLTDAEYFIGEDPGFGNANPIDVQTGDTILSTFEIPLADLSENEFHFLHIRARDSNGKWSHYSKKMFYLMAPDEEHTIVAAEFFIDQDPGMGQGSALPIVPATTINEEFAISIPDTLMDGIHYLHIRVQNDDTTWSHYARKQFMVGEGDGLAEWAMHLEIYPNPTSGIVYLRCENTRIESVTLINIQGQVLLNTKPRDNQLNIADLAKGVYLLQVYTSEGAVSRKIVKQ